MRTRALSIPNQNAGAARAMLATLMAAILLLAQATGAFARPDSFADLATKISPSVVNITTSTMVAARGGPNPVVPEGSPFQDFFREFQDRNGQGERPRRASALGSGFVVSEDGYIVTNNHVIESADEIVIEFFSGEELPAKLIGRDPNTDIALLKVEAGKPLPFVNFGNSDNMRVGDWVVAMGNPLGQGFSVSAGIVSARNRALSGSYDDYLQTDAAINRGNSGGPLFNLDGEVVGVNTAILSPNGGSIGIGFSMASNVVAKVVDQLQQFGQTRRGWLGVRIQDVNADLAESLGLEKAAGALVTDVPDGPAKEGGLLQGDVILSFDGTEVADTRELVRKVGEADVGAVARLVVFRGGKTETLEVTLGRREDAETTTPTAEPMDEAPAEATVMGMTVASLTPELRAELKLADDAMGLVVQTVDETAEAFERGMRPGDLITEAGQTAVETPSDLTDAIEQAKDGGRKSVLLLVRRAGEPRFVALSIE